MNAKSTLDQHRSLLAKIKDKAYIISRIHEKESVLIPVGTSWRNPDFWTGVDYPDGVDIREMPFRLPGVDAIVIQVEARAGARVDVHYHDNKEILLCVSGTVRDMVSGQVLTVGDTWTIPPGQMHGLEFITDTVLCVMWHPKFSSL